VSQIEAGKRTPNILTLLSLTFALDTTPDRLLELPARRQRQHLARAISERLTALSEADLEVLYRIVAGLTPDARQP